MQASRTGQPPAAERVITMRGHGWKALCLSGCFLLAALVVSVAAFPARGQSAVVQVTVPPGAHVPGVVIVDSDADVPSFRSRDMARRLVQAGFATLTVTGDPLSGAAVLRQQPGVRGDDLAIIGYGEGASSVLATIVERYAAYVAQPPVFRSAVAFGPDCARHYGDWVGRSLANLGGPGSTGAPHRGDVASAGLYRTAAPLLIVGGRGDCQELARDSFAHEFFVTYSAGEASAHVLAFLAENAQYSRVAFPSSHPGTTLVGELTVSHANMGQPVIIISPGTAGIEGFSFWERPWARRLSDMGYASLIVDSYMSRHSSWKNHWRIDARTTRARDLLDAQAYLAKQSFVRPQSIGLIGRSSGGTAVFAAIVQDPHAPATPPPFGLDVRPPFAVAVADYGYCQLAYGDWPGGTPTPGAAIAYRTSVPLLVQVGGQDKTVSAPACKALAASAHDAGVPIELEVYPDAIHRFDAGVVETPPATVGASFQRITTFIEAHSTY
jgi:dienelactone hydrolase